jgi:hypothetical protein
MTGTVQETGKQRVCTLFWWANLVEDRNLDRSITLRMDIREIF